MRFGGNFSRSWGEDGRKMIGVGARMASSRVLDGHDGAKRGHDSAKMGHDSAKMGILSSTWELPGAFFDDFRRWVGKRKTLKNHWFS